MLVALFVGDHKADTLAVRLGWWLTRRAQKGAFKCVTHCEAILAGDASAATIASSSAPAAINASGGTFIFLAIA